MERISDCTRGGRVAIGETSESAESSTPTRHEPFLAARCGPAPCHLHDRDQDALRRAASRAALADS